MLRGFLVPFLEYLVRIGAVLRGLDRLAVPLLEMVLVLLVFLVVSLFHWKSRLLLRFLQQ